MRQYILNVLIAINQLLTTILTGGWPDETFSSSCHRRFLQGRKGSTFIRNAVDAIFRILFRQENHCEKAYIEEQERLQLPPLLRR